MTYQELINKLSTLSADELSKPAFAFVGDGNTGIKVQGELIEPLYKLDFSEGKLRLKDNTLKVG